VNTVKRYPLFVERKTNFETINVYPFTYNAPRAENKKARSREGSGLCYSTQACQMLRMKCATSS